VERVVEVPRLVEVVPEWVMKRATELDWDLQHLREDFADFFEALENIQSGKDERPKPEVRLPRQPPVARVERPKAVPTQVTDTTITGGARRMLEVLAWYPKELTRTMLATLAGLKASSGT